MKKKLIALVLALAMALSLVACGGSSSGDSTTADGSAATETETTTDSGSSSGVTLEVKIWDTNQQAGLQEIADEWTEQSGVKVNIQVVDWDNYWTLLEAGASGGEMPDVFWMHSNNAQMYMEAGKLLNLNDYIANSDTVDLDNYYSAVTELYSLDGNQYAIAKDHDTIALLYNKEIFDKYGVDYPTDDWTWDDYYTAAKAITDAGEADGVYGTAFDTSNDQDNFENIIYSYGGYMINEDHTESGWDNENTKKAMEFVGTLCSDVMCPQSVISESGTETMFKSGLLGMIMQGSWMIKTFYDDDNSANYCWAEIPYYDANGDGEQQTEERVSIYNGLGWSANAETQYPDECWSLIEWFSSREMQLKQAELGVTLPGIIDEDAEQAFVDAFANTDISAFTKVAQDGTLVFRPYSKYTSRWETQYKEELVAAWNDPTQMDSVLDNLAAEMNELLAQE